MMICEHCKYNVKVGQVLQWRMNEDGEIEEYEQKCNCRELWVSGEGRYVDRPGNSETDSSIDS